MRIAYVAAMVPRRRELAAGPIDAEWIVDERGPTGVVVFVDYESEGTDLLRQAGVPVYVSTRRAVPFADDGLQTAEELQARILLQLHLEEPFDAILYDSAQTTDWAWHQRRLESIPRGVVLGAGPIRDIRLVTAEPGLFRKHGRKLWALTGTLTSADFLLGEVGGDAYGLNPTGLPPRYSLTGLPTAPPSEGRAGLIAIVALSESPAGLATLVERALNRVATDESTIIAVIHPDIPTGAETTRDIVLGSLPPDLREQVRMAEPSSDGVAEGLLSQAEVVIAARPSDLAVRAVADASAKVGSVVLEGTTTEAPRFNQTTLVKAAHHHSLLVPVDGPLDDIVPLIDGQVGEAPAVVLHAPDGLESARRLWRLPGSSRAGLMMVCEPGPYFGEADPGRPAFNVLGFSMESWPSIRRLLLHVHTLHDLVEAAASPAHAHRTNLLAVPALGVSHGRLRPGTPPIPAWITDTGSLPQPNLAGLTDEDDPGPDTGDGPGDASIKHWAETHGVRDRIRLALPWKWGLLNRAMRDRW